MRLTLRTMLAYLDDVLEPADAEELGRKIQESDFASGLVHRLRSVSQKLRLGAPKLSGKGMGLDPNTVAEYLDSTLSPERVPDFEKVCLESDLHLAEAASCHQILALVLGEPADVPPSMRERIYQIAAKPVVGKTADDAPGDSADKPAVPSVSDQQGKSAPEPPPVQSEATDGKRSTDDKRTGDDKPTGDGKQSKVAASSKSGRDDRVALPDLPDYLRANARKKILPLIATAVLVFLIATVSFFAIGRDTFVSLFSGGSSQKQPAEKDEIQQPSSQLPLPDKSSDETDVTQPEDGGYKTVETPKSNGKPDKAQSGDNEFVTVPPDNAKPKADESIDNPPTPDAIPGVTPAVPSSDPVKPEPLPKNPVDPLNPAPTIPPVTTTPNKPTVDAPDKPTDDRVDLGRYISENQVTARIDAAGDWFRLRAGDRLMSGDQLYVLPNYRSQIALSPGIQANILGASRFALAETGDEFSMRLVLDYGRLTLMTVGRPTSKIGLNLAGRDGVLTFVNAEASVAIELKHYRAPGADPLTDKINTIALIETVRGQVQWSCNEEVTEMKEGEVHVIVDDRPGQTIAVASPSAWINSSGLALIDELAARRLEEELEYDRPIVVSLVERVGDEDVEIRMLASRCLSYLGWHESFVTSLNNAENRSFWDAGFSSAQDALARGPESAAAMQAAFEKLRGEDGAALYRMLVGYSETQLRDEDAAQTLVTNLNHKDLDFRVLSFINLYRITGKMLFYQPHLNDSQRASKVAKWQKLLADNQIIYETPPTIPLPTAIEKK